MTSIAFAVGDLLPDVRLSITGEIIEAFAGIANDNSLMHFDDAFARTRGFPMAIAHGAIAASTFPLLLEHVFGALPGGGHALKITFMGPAFRGDEVVTSGRVAAINAQHAVLEMWCVAGERKLAVAEATVPLAAPTEIRKGIV